MRQLSTANRTFNALVTVIFLVSPPPGLASECVGCDFGDDFTLIQGQLRTPSKRLHVPKADNVIMMQVSVNATTEFGSESLVKAIRAGSIAWQIRDAKAVWLSAAALVLVLGRLRWPERKDGPPPGATCAEFAPAAQADVESGQQGPCPEVQGPGPHSAETPDLPRVGASYVVPYPRAHQRSDRVVGFDVPVSPSTWPFHAIFTREAPKGPWTKIELTVDIIMAAGLPPLLSCVPLDLDVPECGETGSTQGGGQGTFFPGDPADDLYSVDDGSCGGSSTVDMVPWLVITNSSGMQVASIPQIHEEKCIIHRHDGLAWVLKVSYCAKPSVTVWKSGTAICQAVSVGQDEVEHVQVDTVPETQSTDSAVLLMCVLAVLAFGSTK
eukprot:CAMPEP_0168399538 /NCGR_PEP_ID=MMETSP0228-20121227/22137_1 /TAXON_ID=133427 /ORGANISM="Protoceratium reticulatum, Strain CCCM 535 (=CCMP 1889)" /LENGTH=381 /DNA_ID=CAMNT_0008413057 /DNA_START=77 /DNA_END=1222 /DNA_ORIENTATION=-